jgi:hypothetical protein
MPYPCIHWLDKGLNAPTDLIGSVALFITAYYKQLPKHRSLAEPVWCKSWIVQDRFVPRMYERFVQTHSVFG